jgi:hypothetical protein
MFFKEHGIPHFHARYSGQIAVFAIEPFELLRGSLPGSTERLVRDWAQLHQAELMRNWEHARAGERLGQIASHQ